VVIAPWCNPGAEQAWYFSIFDKSRFEKNILSEATK